LVVTQPIPRPRWYLASRIAARTPASRMASDSTRSGVARASCSLPARSPKKAAASARPTALPCRDESEAASASRVGALWDAKVYRVARGCRATSDARAAIGRVLALTEVEAAEAALRHRLRRCSHGCCSCHRCCCRRRPRRRRWRSRPSLPSPRRRRGDPHRSELGELPRRGARLSHHALELDRRVRQRRRSGRRRRQHAQPPVDHRPRTASLPSWPPSARARSAQRRAGHGRRKHRSRRAGVTASRPLPTLLLVCRSGSTSGSTAAEGVITQSARGKRTTVVTVDARM
jgi:hypothetical protein